YYNYIKILDRADNIGGYSFSQRDRIFKEQLNYWFSVCLKLKPELIVFSNVPHLVHDYPLYLIAKKLEIETLIFNVTPYFGWHFLTSFISSKNECNLVDVNCDDNIKKEFREIAIAPYAEKKYFLPNYMVDQINYDRKNKFVLRCKGLLKKILLNAKLINDKNKIRNSYQNSFFSFIGLSDGVASFLSEQTQKMFKRKMIKEYENNIANTDDLKETESFVYVPLHYQPEATTSPLGGFYSDQLYMIEKLRQALPNEVTILVKEHYSQFSDALHGYRGRFLEYWRCISSMYNVKLVPMDIEQEWLILNSLAVATITGTAGWEALQYGKHCIAFGEPWYASHPNLIRFDEHNSSQLYDMIKYERNSDLSEDFVNLFSKSLVKVDLHGYTKGEISRDSEKVSRIIVDYAVNKKR
ncbi:capsular polysaccharide export protein, LipB/KpsS family, partial [Salinivibrio sharmensis]